MVQFWPKSRKKQKSSKSLLSKYGHGDEHGHEHEHEHGYGHGHGHEHEHEHEHEPGPGIFWPSMFLPIAFPLRAAAV